MSFDGKTFLKLSWVLACVSCFIFPLILIPFDGLHSWTRTVLADMGFGMLILAFPSGLLYLLAVGVLVYMFSPNELPVSFYVLLWFGFFVTGYMQWFHLLPHFLNRQGLTTLNL
ncbi:MAG: hypothetical protein JOZ52_00315, partial [Acidobacteria bacterium]|nr:hypothetical protein [Acidobacteriota bacterium]